MRFACSVLGAVLAAAASSANAAVLATTVTATGAHLGNIASVNDGIFPPDASGPFTQQTVYGGRGFGPISTAFNFAFEAPAIVTGLDVSVKGNDRYDFLFKGLDGVETLFSIQASEGRTTGSMERHTRSLSFNQPIQSVRVSNYTGDGYYALGEVQFTGSTVQSAVPEPGTWAMMIIGFGVVGGSLRRRRSFVLRRGGNAALAQLG